MTMASLSETAKRVRKRIMDQVLAQGTCPKVAEIARELSLSKDQLEPILRDLEAAICVAVQKDTHARLDYFQEEKLHEPVPEIGEIFYARPFAAFKNHYPIWVDGEQKWYGECAVEACSVSAMFPGREVIVRSVCRQTKEPVELIGRDGVLLDYSPKTLRVHLGFPLRYMFDDAIGWCDYNSFFGSEDAVNQWRKSHPEIKGITRDPVTISNFVSIIGNGRLDYNYQPTFPLLTLLRHPGKYGLTKPLPELGWHVPDPFFMPTPHMLLEMKRKGYRSFFRFRLS
jgi:hypothetical protein